MNSVAFGPSDFLLDFPGERHAEIVGLCCILFFAARAWQITSLISRMRPRWLTTTYITKFMTLL